MTIHTVTLNGESFSARHGEKLLDAALNNAIDLPHQCRAGHCGTCCVQLVKGKVEGGAGAQPGVVHACQCRVIGDIVVEHRHTNWARTIEGVLSSLRPVADDVVEVGVRVEGALPHHAGQYARLKFKGYPDRPFSITHPLRGTPASPSLWFHIRRLTDGRVTGALGRKIKRGHHVSITGPFGAAYFRPGSASRLILIATSTGFAPIWAIAAAALHENPQRRILVLAGARSVESLYMTPALARLVKFGGVRVVRTCSAPGPLPHGVMPGRPTDYMPRLLPTDIIYACGAPPMVDAVKVIAAQHGVVCYADPFLTNSESPHTVGVLDRAKHWLTLPAASARQASANPSI